MNARALSCLLREILDLDPGSVEEIVRLPERELSRYEVWEVLTALRGPDDPAERPLKAATTAVLRHALLGGYPLGGRADAWPDTSAYQEVRARIAATLFSNSHFMVHAWRAFLVLGLKW